MLYTLSLAVDSYLLHSMWADRSNILYVIWIGANDYLYGTSDLEALSNNVINSIEYNILRLAYHGGKYFLVLVNSSGGLYPSVQIMLPDV